MLATGTGLLARDGTARRGDHHLHARVHARDRARRRAHGAPGAAVRRARARSARSAVSRSPPRRWRRRARRRCPSACTWTTARSWRRSRPASRSATARSCIDGSHKDVRGQRHPDAARGRAGARRRRVGGGRARRALRRRGRVGRRRGGRHDRPGAGGGVRRAHGRRRARGRDRQRARLHARRRSGWTSSGWRAIAAATPVPLVLHGASGLPAEDLLGAVELGVVKVNVNAELRRAYIAALHRPTSATTCASCRASRSRRWPPSRPRRSSCWPAGRRLPADRGSPGHRRRPRGGAAAADLGRGPPLAAARPFSAQPDETDAVRAQLDPDPRDRARGGRLAGRPRAAAGARPRRPAGERRRSG